MITIGDTRLGYTIGGGIETQLVGNWFARGEYRYADFGTGSYRSPGLRRSSSTISTSGCAPTRHCSASPTSSRGPHNPSSFMN